MKDAKQFSITTPDGTLVTCIRYEPSSTTKAEIIVGGATAVPQRFYKRFAEFANQQGYAVSTIDYRGIGLSAPKTLRGYRMNYLDWARQDIASLINHVDKTKNPLHSMFMVGHSYGGHAFGLINNHALVKKLYVFAGGAGWSGYMPSMERLKVELLWRVIGPVVTPLTGYMPGRFVGGENLPIDVYHQWRRWCSYPHYFFDDPTLTHELHNFPLVTSPIIAANADDDLWALPASRDAFFKAYVNAPRKMITLESAKFGPKGIGHMGYFRKGSEVLWEQALSEFKTD